MLRRNKISARIGKPQNAAQKRAAAENFMLFLLYGMKSIAHHAQDTNSFTIKQHAAIIVNDINATIVTIKQIQKLRKIDKGIPNG